MGATRNRNYNSILKNISYHYGILGLDLDATKEELIRAYKEAHKMWDAERCADDPSFCKKALKKTKEIDKAYEKILIYMTHPQYQHHPFGGRQPLAADPEIPVKKKVKEEPPQKRMKISVPRLSLFAVKPLTAIPNIMFLSYVIVVIATKIFRYEAFSVNLLPVIFKVSFGLLLPPLIGCLAFNFVHGDASKAKIASIVVTSLWLLVVFPFEANIYQKMLQKNDAALENTEAPLADAEWINKANELKGKKQYAAAIQAYSKALKINPASAEAYYGRAVLYSLQEKETEFVDDCKSAARLGNVDAIKALTRLNIAF